MEDLNWLSLGIALVVGIVLGGVVALSIHDRTSEARKLKLKLLELREDLEEQLRRAENLPNLLVSLSSAQEAGNLHEEIVRIAREHLKGDFAALFLSGAGEEEEYSIVASEGLSEETHRTLKLPTRAGLLQYLSETNRPVRIGKGDRQLAPFRKFREDIREIVIAPLNNGREIIGAVWAARQSEGPFYTASDLSLLNYMAVPFSQAIHNGRYFRELQGTLDSVLVDIARQVENRDPYSRGQSGRVATICLRAGQRLRLSRRDLENLELAARLHRLGYLAIPFEILNKPGELTEEELALVRTHPKRAVELLKRFGHLERILPLVLYHHERYDGSGYPFQLKGSAIPVGATVIGMAVYYDALTHERPHRPALSPTEAIEAMRRLSGSQFDPRLLDPFLHTIEQELLAPGKNPKLPEKPAVPKIKLT
ncbi:MAG: GAF domain-containing protein [Armatimonadetes bacterium]|nr:GAF domain-containing protein [Armatimonadota bacterium]